MSRSVIVSLKANVDGFIANIAKAQAAAENMAGSLSQASRGADWNRVSSDLLKVGAAATAAVGLVSKAAISWQSDWAGVQKTVDGTTQQMGVLEDQLRGMARSMPATHTEIAAVAEAAGQLGVATEDVAKFSEVMIQLGETTNLSADAAATSIAQFTNIMGTSRSEVDRLGATLVQLGNNGASTESDIMALGHRLAGVGAQMNMTEADVLGMANAMASVGIEAEAGGTAMTLTLKGIDTAVRTGGRELETYARTAGMTAEQFAKAWGEDAAMATAAFVEGLGDAAGRGEDMNAILDELGINGVRQADTLIRLAGATKGAGAANDLLRDSLEMGAQAWQQNSALTDEHGKRVETAEAQIQIAWNNIKDAAISAGQNMLPVVAGLAKQASSLAQVWGEIPGPVHAAGVGLTAFVGVGALAAGGIMKTVTAVSEFRAAMATMPAFAARGVGALGMLGLAAAGVTAALLVANAIGSRYQAGLDESRLSAEQYENALLKLARTGTNELGGSFAAAQRNVTTETWAMVDAFYSIEASGGGWIESLETMTAGLVGMEGTIAASRAEFGKLDTTLASMDPADAGQAFRHLGEQLSDAGMSAQQMVDYFPQYATVLEASAAAMGVFNLTAGELAGWMQGIEPRAVGVAQLMAELGVAHLQAGASAAEQAAALRSLMDMQQEAASAALGASNAQIAYHQALDNAAQVIKANTDEYGNLTISLTDNSAAFDLSTESGRAAQGSLDAIASAALRSRDAMRDNGASTQELTAHTQSARDAFIDAAIQMGMNSDAANRLADSYGLIPTTVTTDVSAPGATISTQQAGALFDALMKVPANRRTEVISAFQRGGVDAAYAALNGIDGRVANTFIRTYYETIGTPPNHWAGGGLTKAFGGPVFGPGTTTSDSVPAMLSTGEHVLTAREVDALGGHAAVYRMRVAALSGDMPAFARGGAVAEANPSYVWRLTDRAHARTSYARSETVAGGNFYQTVHTNNADVVLRGVARGLEKMGVGR